MGGCPFFVAMPLAKNSCVKTYKNTLQKYFYMVKIYM